MAGSVQERHATRAGGRGGSIYDWVPPKRPVPRRKRAPRREVQPLLSRVGSSIMSDVAAAIERMGQPSRLARRSPNGGVQRADAIDSTLQEFNERQQRALDRLDAVAQRLASVVGRLESQLEERPAAPVPREVPAPAPVEAAQPVRDHVTIILTPVSDFQDLMNLHRTLRSLPAATGASVVTYKNGEASFELLLRAGMSASEIVGEIQRSTGQRMLIEESRSDALRLRASPN